MRDPYHAGKAGWDKRHQLGESQNWRCCYCGVRMAFGNDAPDSMTIEHLKPVVDGGRRVRDNEVVACKLCNGGRSNVIEPLDYYSLVRQLGREMAAKIGREKLQARAVKENRERQQRRFKNWPKRPDPPSPPHFPPES